MEQFIYSTLTPDPFSEKEPLLYADPRLDMNGATEFRNNKTKEIRSKPSEYLKTEDERTSKHQE
jgi:hypothetical protein